MFKNIRVILPCRYHQTLSKILKKTQGTVPDFAKIQTMKGIHQLVKDMYGIDMDTPHTTIYFHWISHGLRPKHWGHKHNTDLTDSMVELYGLDVLKRAITAYSTVIHRDDLYCLCEAVTLENWLLSDIRPFISGSCFTKYKRPDVLDNPNIWTEAGKLLDREPEK